MFELLRDPLLRFLRVPPSPDPPAGSADSTQVFRAARNFYIWSVIIWLVAQTGIALGVSALIVPAAIGLSRNTRMPDLARFAIMAAGIVIVSIYLLQLLVTFFALRLGYEMRWYIVTDRSLRIRAGVWSVEELTMTFANIQQITVKQGPLQRVLGIADVKVVSAGGAGGGGGHGKHGPGHNDGHAGNFEGVDNANIIRDLILDRLRRYKDSGLGDPDHHDDTPPSLSAAQEVLQETRLLRAATSRS
ncbi:MAG: PH domain-containing protein [Acidobacteriota bacterium]